MSVSAKTSIRLLLGKKRRPAASAGGGNLASLWSFHKYGSYSGPCLRVRRSSDNAEQDIGWNGSLMDQATLLSFVGAGTGFKTTFYDQIGTRHLTQATTGNQPVIVQPVAVVQSIAGNGAAAASRIVTPGVAPTFGNYQVMFVAVTNGSSSSVTGISQTNCTWTRLATVTAAGVLSLDVWVALVGASPGAAATISYSGSVTQSAAYYELSGVLSLDSIRATTTNSDGTSGLIPAVVAGDGDMVLGALAINSAKGFTTTTNSYTLGVQTTANTPEVATAYKQMPTGASTTSTLGTAYLADGASIQLAIKSIRGMQAAFGVGTNTFLTYVPNDVALAQTPVTLAVMGSPGSGSSRAMLSVGSNVAGGRPTLLRAGNTNAAINYNTNQIGGANGNFPDQTNRVLVGTCNDVENTIRCLGLETATAATVLDIGSGEIAMGRNAGAGSGFWDGTISEGRLYSGASDRAVIETAMRTDWGI